MISAIVLVKDAEGTLEKCLQSLTFCEEIIVVDDFSLDASLDIAKKYTSKIHRHALESDFAAQRNFAAEHASQPWLLYIDADEEVTPGLRKEIQTVTHDSSKKEIKGYFLKRLDYMWGREVSRGEVWTASHVGLLRLMRANSGIWKGKVHEVFVLSDDAAKTETLNGYIYHYSHPSVKLFLNQINLYSSIRADELADQEVSMNTFSLFVKPCLKFMYTYFIKLGFLDGAPGFLYSFMMSFHSFLVRAKLMQKQLQPLDQYKT